MNHSDSCGYYERLLEQDCDCLAGKQVEQLRRIADAVEELVAIARDEKSIVV